MEDFTEFAIEVDEDDDHVVARVHGELDLASVDTFEAAIAPVASSQHVVLDLSSCTLLDSAGMRVIAATVRQAPRVSIIATEPGVLRALEITAMDTMVSVHASLKEAL